MINEEFISVMQEKISQTWKEGGRWKRFVALVLGFANWEGLNLLKKSEILAPQFNCVKISVIFIVLHQQLTSHLKELIQIDLRSSRWILQHFVVSTFNTQKKKKSHYREKPKKFLYFSLLKKNSYLFFFLALIHM